MDHILLTTFFFFAYSFDNSGIIVACTVEAAQTSWVPSFSARVTDTLCHQVSLEILFTFCSHLHPVEVFARRVPCVLCVVTRPESKVQHTLCVSQSVPQLKPGACTRHAVQTEEVVRVQEPGCERDKVFWRFDTFQFLEVEWWWTLTSHMG